MSLPKRDIFAVKYGNMIYFNLKYGLKYPPRYNSASKRYGWPFEYKIYTNDISKKINNECDTIAVTSNIDYCGIVINNKVDLFKEM